MVVDRTKYMDMAEVKKLRTIPGCPDLLVNSLFCFSPDLK